MQRSPDFGFPRIKGPERNSCERSQVQKTVGQEEHLLPLVAEASKATQTTRPVMWTGGWGLTMAPCPWLVEDLSSYTHSCPGGSAAGSPTEAASCAAACFFLHVFLIP